MKDYEQQLAEKDAEIERLKAIIEDLSDHGCAAERMEYIRKQSFEIEQLRRAAQRTIE